MEDKPYKIEYQFQFDNNQKKCFILEFDPQTMKLIRPENNKNPEWTQLENEQCSCCTFNKVDTSYCPVAVNISELLEEFKDSLSTENCTVYCVTPERTYYKEASLQEGLFSVLGVIMATSNCPVTEFLRPMARFHLPFATIQETIFRASSVYLLRQYFEAHKGKTPDLKLEKLDGLYEKIQIVNLGILARTKKVVKKDAEQNAIIILNALAQMLSMEISDNLNSIEYLFTP